MIYSTEVQHMCPVAKGAYHGPAPIPEEGKWVQAKEIKDISGFTHGVGWCDLAAQALAQVLQGSAHGQAVLGESGLGAAIDDLQEQLPHGGVDGIAHQGQFDAAVKYIDPRHE